SWPKLRIADGTARCSSLSHSDLSPTSACNRTVTTTSRSSGTRSFTVVPILRLIVGAVVKFGCTRGPFGDSKEISLMYTACGGNCGAFGSTAPLPPAVDGGVCSVMVVFLFSQ